jgi:hypothetical protein
MGGVYELSRGYTFCMRGNTPFFPWLLCLPGLVKRNNHVDLKTNPLHLFFPLRVDEPKDSITVQLQKL